MFRHNGQVLEPSGEFSSTFGAEEEEDDDDDELSGGEIVGIVIAVVIGIVLVTLIVVRMAMKVLTLPVIVS